MTDISAQIIDAVGGDPSARNALSLNNLVPGALMRWRQALARVRTGGKATIALVGDSTWMGAGGSTSTAWRPNGPGKKLPAAMASRGFTMLPYNNFFGKGAVEGTGAFGNVDSRIVTTGSVTTQRGPTVGGYPAFCGTAAAGTIAFTYTGAMDTIDLYLLQTGVSAGAWSVDVDGVATTPASVATPQGTEAPLKVTVATAVAGAGTHVLTLTRLSGQPGLVGIDAYQSAAAGIRVWQMGWGGSGLGNWTALVPQYAAPMAVLTQFIVPDLAIVNNGINDALNIRNGVDTIATYRAKLDTLVRTISGAQTVNGATGTADVILRTHFPSDPDQVPIAIQDAVAQTCRDVAVANGIPYIDQYRAYGGSWNRAKAYQMTADGFHPSLDIGYWDMVRLDAAALASFGTA